MIFQFVHVIRNFYFVLFFILHGDLMFSLAYDYYLESLDISTRFQVAIIYFGFSTGEGAVFPIDTNS